MVASALVWWSGALLGRFTVIAALVRFLACSQCWPYKLQTAGWPAVVLFLAAGWPAVVLFLAA